MSDLYLTDEQYIEILNKIKSMVNKEGFKPYIYDSTETGNKFTESNCGFCNDSFITKANSLSPDRYPAQKSMKYRANHHPCPFDKRFKGIDYGEMYGLGCYYYCTLTKRVTIEAIKKSVDRVLKYSQTLNKLREE